MVCNRISNKLFAAKGEKQDMSTGENILMLILGIVLMVGSLWLTYRSDRERWKEYFRSTRKVYWVSLGCWALLFLLVYLWVVLG